MANILNPLNQLTNILYTDEEDNEIAINKFNISLFLDKIEYRKNSCTLEKRVKPVNNVNIFMT